MWGICRPAIDPATDTMDKKEKGPRDAALLRKGGADQTSSNRQKFRGDVAQIKRIPELDSWQLIGERNTSNCDSC
jgi:hypothetical protein